MKRRRLFAAPAILALALFLLPPLPARADAVTDTIEIGVGYYGWPESDYKQKAVYHWSELDDLYGGALDTWNVIYSYTNGTGRVYMAAARGFYVRDLLEYAGVDFHSIASVDFFTKDHANGAYRSFTKYSLFDLPRYYFPNLAANEETGILYPYDGGDLWTGASRVEAMLALEDYTEWLDFPDAAVEFEQRADWTLLGTANRFHLFFGQYEPAEANTSSAAKYCYKLLVTFSGTPVLGTEETDMTLKLGSGRKLEVTVDAEDALLNDYVRENLTWESSDPAVVSVAPDGTLSVHAPGEASVTASFGESSVSVNVRVDADAAGTDSAGLAGGGGAENETSPPEPEAAPAEAPRSGAELALPPEEAPAEAAPGKTAYAISPAALAALLQGSENAAADSGGAMEPDSAQLVLALPEREDYVPFALAAAGAALALGAVFEIIRFKRLLRGRS